MTEVVLAPVWVWALLGEPVATNPLLGGSAVLAAVALQACFAAKSVRVES